MIIATEAPSRDRAAALRFPQGSRLTRHETWERANRRGLLFIHGFIGLFAGALILFNGSIKSFEAVGAWTRPVTGLLALLGGCILIAGLSQTRRAMRLEIIGLSVLATWDLVMCAGFVIAAVKQTNTAIEWPWDAITAQTNTVLYPIVLYVGLFLMMTTHLWTIRQVNRASPVR